MKRLIQSTFFIALAVIGISVTLSSSSNGRAFAANDGNTGAPGESTTCRSCHGTGFGTNVGLVVKGSNGFPVTAYVPGNTYEVEVTVNTSSGNPSRYGFQLLSLLANGSNLNAWSNPSGNTRIASGGSRSYAEHAGKSVSNTFTVDWTAPVAGTGGVRFYAGGAAVNNNGSTSGDGGNVIQFLLNEGINTGIDSESLSNVEVYPNPTKDVIRIKNSGNEQINQISLFSSTGQLIFQNDQFVPFSEQTIDVVNYDKGIYYLQLTSNSGAVSSRKIIIQ